MHENSLSLFNFCIGNPGRDFRGSTDGLVRATDPDKFYKVYQSSPLGSG